jgi:DNA-binding NtrC family response regulator
MKIKILLIDDDVELTKEVSGFLSKHDYEIKIASSYSQYSDIFKDYQPEIVLLDLKLPDRSGLEILEEIKSDSPVTTVVILSGYGTIDIAVEAIKKGAENFLTKPIDPDHLILLLDKIVKQKQLQNRLLANDLYISDRHQLIIGNNKKMKDVIRKAEAAAQASSTILITGETGTGKHLVAHFIHQKSPRKDFPFVYINCATLSDTLLESDLFGHEKGSFTGAYKQKIGRMELANRGTLFLDEIGELPLNLQAKILHFIEYGEFQRLGGTKTLTADTRILSATNRKLESLVKEGKFREDLYFRVNVIQIEIPPLRERIDEISVLIDFFLEKFKLELGRKVCRIQESVRKNLESYSWPGNVRELQNAIERAMVLCQSNQLTAKDFPFLQVPVTLDADDLYRPRPLADAINDFKKNFISTVLKSSNNNQTRCAEVLGVQRTYLNRLVKELNLNE